MVPAVSLTSMVGGSALLFYAVTPPPPFSDRLIDISLFLDNDDNWRARYRLSSIFLLDLMTGSVFFPPS